MSLAMRALVSLSLVTALAACGEKIAGGGDCRDGTPIACTCADGRPGTGVCGVGACDCPPRYALEADPGSVDFGEVARGTSRDATVRLRNPSPREVRLRPVQLLGDDRATFALPEGAPAAIPAGGAVTVALRFTPAIPGTVVARLRVEADDADVAPVEVILSARVPGPALSCGPAEVAFVNTRVGETAGASVVCLNVGLAGAGDDARLVLDRLEVEGDGFSATWRDGAPPAAGLAVGEAAAIELVFAPAAVGTHHGTVTVAGGGIEGSIPLAGLAVEMPACDVSYPEQLRFGIAGPGQELSLGFEIRNNRTDAPCQLRNLQLCEGTDAAYTLVGAPFESVVIPGGGAATFELRVTPGRDSCEDGATTGCIEFDLATGALGLRSIELFCTAPETAVIVAPNEVDFGAVQVACATRDRSIEILNVGPVPLTLGAIEMAEGSDDEFFVRDFPPRGTTVSPGLSQFFTVAYRPVDDGPDIGAVQVWVEGLDEPFTARLTGSGERAEGHDTFVQGARPKVDVLFVIDNGTTMGTESARMAAALGGFPAFALAQGVDFRFAVTTTGLVAGGPGCPGGVNGGEDGRFFPVDGTRLRILDEHTPNLAATFVANLAVGTCHTAPPQTLEAAVRALTPPLSTNADDPRHGEEDDGNLGFLRPAAHLSVIAISDRADASPGTVDAYYQALLALKGERNRHLFNFHAITGDRNTGCTAADGGTAVAGDRLLDLVDRTDGGVGTSICDTNWDAVVREMSTAAFGFRSCFFLGNQPEDVNRDGVISDADGELRVSIEGVAVPSTIDGAPVWHYSPEQIAVCFAPDHVPAEEATLQIDYYVACRPW